LTEDGGIQPVATNSSKPGDWRAPDQRDGWPFAGHHTPDPTPPSETPASAGLAHTVRPGTLFLGSLIVLAIILTGFSTSAVLDRDRKQAENTFLRESRQTLSDLQQSMWEKQRLAEQMGGLMATVGYDQLPLFEQMAQRSLDEVPGLARVIWIEPGTNLTFSDGMLRSRFDLLVVDSNGISPLPGVIGGSVGSSTPDGRNALERAILSSNAAVSSEMVQLAGDQHRHQQQQQHQHTGVSLFHPVYRGFNEVRLLGIVQLDIRFDQLLEPLLTSNAFAVHLFDINEGAEILLHSSAGDGPAAAGSQPATLRELGMGGNLNQSFLVADRLWAIWLTPEGAAARTTSFAGWMTLLNGGGITLLLIVMAVFWHRRLTRAHDLLNQRGRELNGALERAHLLEIGSERLYQAASEAEERYQMLLSSSDDVILHLSLEGRITFATENCTALVGYTPEQLTALAPLGLLDPEYGNSDDHFKQLLMSENDHHYSSCALLHREGKRVWVESNHQLRRDQDGKPQYILIRARSISDHFHAADTLLRNARLFRGIFENANLGMALLSLEDGRYLKVNQAFASMLGYNCSELQEMSYLDITDPSDAHLNPMGSGSQLAGQAEGYRVEKRYVHKQGKVIRALVSVSMLRDEQGQPTHLSAQIQDLSDFR